MAFIFRKTYVAGCKQTAAVFERSEAAMLHTLFFSNFSRKLKEKLAIQQTIKIACSNLLLLDFYCLLKSKRLPYFAIIKASY